MREKPILIGMNNPVSQRDGFQLYPAPEGCTGHRLWAMLHERRPTATRLRYLETFERLNLVTGRAWSPALGRAEAKRQHARLWGSGRTVVLLGVEVVRCFELPRLLVEPQVIGGCTWRQIPHPSGRNLWYNDPGNRKTVGLLLEELYEAYHRDNGVVLASGILADKHDPGTGDPA